MLHRDWLFRAVVLMSVLLAISLVLNGVEWLRQTETNEQAAQETRAIAGFAVNTVQQNIDARHDDCLQLNHIRAGLRASVQQSKVTDPILFKLVPSLNTPQVRRIVATNDKRELQEFRAIDCKAYARRAIPPGDHHRYHVP